MRRNIMSALTWSDARIQMAEPRRIVPATSFAAAQERPSKLSGADLPTVASRC